MQAIEDNSKVGYGKNEPLNRKLFKKGCICVVNNGSAIGYSYYQPHLFTCTHDVNPLTLKTHDVNENEALFLARMIRQQGVCFIYARKWRPTRMIRSQFMLPVNISGNPDYAYMAEYTKQKRARLIDIYRKYVEKRISEIGEEVEIPKLDEKNWHEFYMNDIFVIGHGFYNKNRQCIKTGKYHLLERLTHTMVLQDLLTLKILRDALRLVHYQTNQ